MKVDPDPAFTEAVRLVRSRGVRARDHATPEQRRDINREEARLRRAVNEHAAASGSRDEVMSAVDALTLAYDRVKT